MKKQLCVGVLATALLVLTSVGAVSLSGARAAKAASVESVSASVPDGTYKVGDKFWIEVRFSETIELTGGLALVLETGPTDRIAFCDGPETTAQILYCVYTVQVGDKSQDLDVQSKYAVLPTGTFKANGIDVDLTLPEPGSANSLSGRKNIVIDGSGADEQWQFPPSVLTGLHNVKISEDLRENVSFIMQDRDYNKVCRGLSDPSCAGKPITFRSVLPLCSSSEQLDCLEGVYASKANGSEVAGAFKEVFPKKGALDFDGSKALKVPDGRTTSIFTFKEFPHSLSEAQPIDTYAVTVSITGYNNADGTAGYRSMFASVTPVSFRETGCDERNFGQCLDGADGRAPINGGVGADQREGYRCILWDAVDGDGDGKIQTQLKTGDTSTCALKQPFPEDVRFTVKARLSQEPSGWLHGRLADPKITYETATGVTKVSVSALPVKVPVIAGNATYKAMDKGLQKYYDDLCASVPTCFSPSNSRQQSIDTPKELRTLVLEPTYYSKQAFDVIKVWKDFLNDTATVVPSYWNVRTLSADEMGKAPACISAAKGVTGIVTTNATAYFEGPPSFDTKTKTLQYEVSAPHYEKDGKTEFKGVYNLIVREDVAECMYGFSNAFAAPAPPEEFADESDPDVYVEEEPYTDEDIYAEEYPEFEEEFVDTDDGSYEMYEDVEYEEVSLDEYVEEEEDFTLTEDVSDSGEVVEEEEVFEETVVASIDAEILTELQKAATANTAIELADGWFKFSATNFTFSKPTVKVNFAATPSKVLACVAGSTIKYVKSIRSQCPAGSSVAKTAYCVKGKAVDAVVGASPKCPKGTKVAKTLKCAKGDDARLVVAIAPKCAKGWSKVTTYICVKGNIARRVSAVQVKCANGFALAKQLNCVKGKSVKTVTAVKPTCPKGYRVKK